MKFIRFGQVCHFGLVWLSILSWFSCQSRPLGQNNPVDQTIRLDSIVKIDTFPNFSSSPDSSLTSFRFKYLYYKGLDSLNRSINQCFFGSKFASLSPQTLVDAYTQECMAKTPNTEVSSYTSVRPFPKVVTWRYDLSFKQEYVFDNIISLSSSEFDHEVNLGQNQFPNQTFASFDLRTHKKITEQDILVDYYREGLAEVILTKLMQDYKVHTIEDLSNEGFFAPNEITPNGNFMISPTGLRYCFRPEEILPYSWGSVYVDLTWDEISHLIRPGSIIERYL